MAATSNPSLLARAQNMAAAQRRRPAPPKQPASSTRGTPLPAFMQGSKSAAATVAAQTPRGNAQAVMQRYNMPSPFTADMRNADILQRRYGPVVGSRADMATVASFQGLEGLDGWFSKISLTKLTNWTGNAVKAIASKDPAAILSVAAAAVPGGKTPTITAKPPVPVQQPTQVEQMFTSMKPQNSTQMVMMAGAGVLGIGLIALLLRRR